MKTIKNATLIALTLLTATQAVASTCDLSVDREIIERQNEVTIHTVRGNRDNLHRPGKKIGAAFLTLAATPTIIGLVLTTEVIPEMISRGRRGGENDDGWYAEQRTEVTQQCHDYIRENFREDVISDNGVFVTARHYRCSEPYIYNYRHFAKVSVDVLYSDPVYTEMSPDQVIAQKCQKLTQCLLDASDASELEQLQQTQIQLGCQ